MWNYIHIIYHSWKSKTLKSTLYNIKVHFIDEKIDHKDHLVSNIELLAQYVPLIYNSWKPKTTQKSIPQTWHSMSQQVAINYYSSTSSSIFRRPKWPNRVPGWLQVTYNSHKEAVEVCQMWSYRYWQMAGFYDINAVHTTSYILVSQIMQLTHKCRYHA